MPHPAEIFSRITKPMITSHFTLGDPFITRAFLAGKNTETHQCIGASLREGYTPDDVLEVWTLIVKSLSRKAAVTSVENFRLGRE